jgi:pimeloyl-ACP methyl ester carboxylesterase
MPCAGSELLSDSFGTTQQEETKSINLSLFSLVRVIEALRDKASYVPYRESALTKILCNSLGGNALTSIICAVSPSNEHARMSRKTLSFGMSAQRVMNCVQRKVFRLALDKKDKDSGDGAKKDDYIEHRKDVPMICLPRIDEVGSAAWKKTQSSHEKRSEKEDLDASVDARTCEMSEFDMDIPQGCVHLHACGDPKHPLALVLHGFGGGCDGLDWEWVIEPLARVGYYVLCPDFPGFGKSPSIGPSRRQTYRTEKMLGEDGPIETVFQIMNGRSAMLVGYDWGAGMALKMASQKQYQKHIRGVIAFHVSWTDRLAELNMVRCHVLLLWVKCEQLHPYRLGLKIAKVIPKCDFIKLDCGVFREDKTYGLYELLSIPMLQQIKRWVGHHGWKTRTATATAASSKSKGEDALLDGKAKKRNEKVVVISPEHAERGGEEDTFSCWFLYERRTRR